MNESEARSVLEAEAAAAGERLLWWGRPAAGRSALRSLPASLFGIPFTGFALFWMWSAAGGLGDGPRSEGPWLLFPLFGLPFVIIGLGLLLSPLFAAGAARRTLYAVTSGAVLVVKGARARRVERHALPEEGVLRRVQRPDGSGDLDVARAEVATARDRGAFKTTTFVGIPDVARVERIVADAARAWRDGRRSGPGPARADPNLGGAPTGRTPHRTSGSLPGAPPYRDRGSRRLPVLALLVIGLLAGFAVALALGRAGKLPAGWLEPEAASAPPAEGGAMGNPSAPR